MKTMITEVEIIGRCTFKDVIPASPENHVYEVTVISVRLFGDAYSKYFKSIREPNIDFDFDGDKAAYEAALSRKEEATAELESGLRELLEIKKDNSFFIKHVLSEIFTVVSMKKIC